MWFQSVVIGQTCKMMSFSHMILVHRDKIIGCAMRFGAKIVKLKTYFNDVICHKMFVPNNSSVYSITCKEDITIGKFSHSKNGMIIQSSKNCMIVQSPKNCMTDCSVIQKCDHPFSVWSKCINTNQLFSIITVIQILHDPTI